MAEQSQELVSVPVMAALTRQEIDAQIATAKQFPRDVERCKNTALALIRSDPEFAESCTYRLERRDSDGTVKVIDGPSARFAEVLAHSWGNCRWGARIVEDQDKCVVAQAVFVDLETNAGGSHEVRRRIVNKKGHRYSDDMVIVTANAACSIARRNAILAGIPKPYWKSLHTEAEKAALGKLAELPSRRGKMLAAFAAMGVDDATIFTFLAVDTENAIGLQELQRLRGIYQAIRDGDTTVREAFSLPERTENSKIGRSEINDQLGATEPPLAQDTHPATPASYGDETGALSREEERVAFGDKDNMQLFGQ